MANTIRNALTAAALAAAGVLCAEPAPSVPDSAAAPDSAFLPPLEASVEVRMSPTSPRAGEPFDVVLVLRWEGPEMLLAAPRGWSSFDALEPVGRSETQSRRALAGGKVENRRDFVLRYRPLREGTVDLSGLSVVVARAVGADTLAVPPWKVEIRPRPLLPAWAWLAAVAAAGAAVLAGLRIRRIRAARAAAASDDPRSRLAARWRALRDRLRRSAEDRSWLAEACDLAREALLLEGADPSARPEEAADSKISAVADDPALCAAWRTMRDEMVHSLYGGGVRPVAKNRETLRALRVCLGLNDEETT